jgi:hypothetical protein
MWNSWYLSQESHQRQASCGRRRQRQRQREWARQARNGTIDDRFDVAEMMTVIDDGVDGRRSMVLRGEID